MHENSYFCENKCCSPFCIGDFCPPNFPIFSLIRVTCLLIEGDAHVKTERCDSDFRHMGETC